MPDPDVEEALVVGDAQIAALQADVRARRQVCHRTNGAPFSETLGIVALASAAHAHRVLEQAHTNAPVHPFKCRCNQCPHFDNDPDVDANDDLIMTERVGDFEVGMSVDVPHHYGNVPGVIEYIYFSEGDPCLCIYFEEVPRYGLRGQRQDVFVSVLLEALGREE